MSDRTCSVNDCSQSVIARGWCWRHYQRWRRHGTVEGKDCGGTLAERFMRRIVVDPDTGCWKWTGHIDPVSGYGRIQVDGQTAYTHRVSYEMHVGPIPDGLHLDHLCRNRACSAPQHLEPVTCLENVQRGEGHGSETHCPQGHPYAGDNLYLHTDAKGQTRRHCRACSRVAVQRWKARQST